MSFLAGSMVKKQREITEENGTTSPLCHTCQTCNYHTRGHSNYLMVSAMKEAAKKKKTQQKMTPPNLYAMHAEHVTITSEKIQIASQYLQLRQLQRRKHSKKMTPLNLYAIHAKHVTIIPEDMQLPCSMHSEKAARKKIRTVSMVQH